jgi:DNA-binding MarR family transcriptional regulator
LTNLRSFWSSAQPAWRQLDLPLGQVKALIIVAQEECISIGTLAERIGLSRPQGSALVSHLVQRDLVSRTDDLTDRRRALVRLTAAGNALIEDLFPTGQRTLLGLATRLADSELVGLAQGLRALARALDGTQTEV